MYIRIYDCRAWEGASGKKSSYNAQEGLLPLISFQKRAQNIRSAQVKKSYPKCLMLSKFPNFI